MCECVSECDVTTWVLALSSNPASLPMWWGNISFIAFTVESGFPTHDKAYFLWNHVVVIGLYRLYWASWELDILMGEMGRCSLWAGWDRSLQQVWWSVDCQLLAPHSYVFLETAHWENCYSDHSRKPPLAATFLLLDRYGSQFKEELCEECWIPKLSQTCWIDCVQDPAGNCFS